MNVNPEGEQYFVDDQMALTCEWTHRSFVQIIWQNYRRNWITFEFIQNLLLKSALKFRNLNITISISGTILIVTIT